MERLDACLATFMRRVLQGLGMASPAANPPTLAVFYGEAVPLDALLRFDRVIVEADHLDSPLFLTDAGVEVHARINVGPAAGPRDSTAAFPASLHPNGTGPVADLAGSGCLRILLEARMADLWHRGYRGFFLEGLDGGEPPSDAACRDEALVAFVRAAHERFPGVKLLAHQGFRILSQIAPLLSGLVAGPLFRQWDAESRRYMAVADSEREYLLERLREARDCFRLPVAVIEYLPPSERDAARDLAQCIKALGFSPWVANASLDMLGVGGVEIQPRCILALFDGGEFPDFRDSPAYRWLALPVKYMGFAIEPLDAREPLPAYPLIGRYAGIVTWFAGDALPEPERYQDWLAGQMDAGMPVAILGRLGFSPNAELLRRLGLTQVDEPALPLRFVRRGDFALFEAEPAVPWPALPAFTMADSVLRAHLILSDAEGRHLVAVAVGPWGGLALDPYVMERGASGQVRWLLNPFKFLACALRLPPVPDSGDEAAEEDRAPVVRVRGGAASLPARLRGV
jgi:hypothetical protein